MSERNEGRQQVHDEDVSVDLPVDRFERIAQALQESERCLVELVAYWHPIDADQAGYLRAAMHELMAIDIRLDLLKARMIG